MKLAVYSSTCLYLGKKDVFVHRAIWANPENTIQISLCEGTDETRSICEKCASRILPVRIEQGVIFP